MQAEEAENGPTDRWWFESIVTKLVKPGEDLQAAIKDYAKVSLEAGATYELSESVIVNGACYIIGNSAIIKGKLNGPIFQVYNRAVIPSVGFMERVAFTNIIFDCQGASTAVCCLSERNVLFHGCIFSGPHMLCIDAKAGAEIRGCQFMGAVCAIRSRGLYSIRLKHSSFEKCVFGLVAGKAAVSHCFFRDCTCAIRLGGSGKICYCQFIVTNNEAPPMNLQLCTCQDGSHVSALGNIHISSHRSAPWPKFSNNMLQRVRLYLGARTGIFHPKYCLLGMSVIAAPRGVAQRMYLFSVYDSSCAVVQLTPTFERTSPRMCTCGSSHETPVMRGTYVTDTRLDRYLNSLDTAEFSSSDED